jgi:GalNAc-alpha-(1->4)-GalNAc-alpha-(1->3)-diNAcBac-PP-undecaprenol alpha-1,4-N-acetyl-D-galactosaminyltransferase
MSRVRRSIAIVIESLGGGGAQHVATTLANAWCAADVTVTVITLKDRTFDAFALEGGISRIVIGHDKPSSSLAAAIGGNVRRLLALRRAVKASAADTLVSFVGATNILTVLAAFGLGKRVVISERNDPALQSLGRIWDILRRWCYRHADLVVANSRNAIATLSSCVPERKLVWLPNPLRAAGDTKAEPTLPSTFFLAIGRLNAQKGFDVLLEAFAQIAPQLPGCDLVILGEGPLKEALARQAAQLRLSDRVHFRGYIADPFPWYRAAIGLVHPARYEGLPNAVLEAMSMSKTVIVTDTQEGLRGIVRDRETGFVVPVESVPHLVEAMLCVASDQVLRGRIGVAAREAVLPFRKDRALAAWASAMGLP